MDEHSNAVLAAKMSRTYRVCVSCTKKPIVFYLNLAKKYIRLYHKVEITALGMAIPAAVVTSEILKRNGVATQKQISLSLIDTTDEFTGKPVKKAKMEIVMEKTAESAKPKKTVPPLKKRIIEHKDETYSLSASSESVDSMNDDKVEDDAMIENELEGYLK